MSGADNLANDRMFVIRGSHKHALHIDAYDHSSQLEDLEGKQKSVVNYGFPTSSVL